jgi:hypothetical protein
MDTRTKLAPASELEAKNGVTNPNENAENLRAQRRLRCA